ncbi:hypothetical protein WN59_12845 [Salinicoccus sediminis]|uniref:DAGKc domain-containing protein n=1 Tax=Salinicoccus sediminis TaxID=1432562 RepID=A0A0M2SDX7_9STAP|nr:diacylglycerol kinase family protein [Salinicoccus sediminis]KKK32929.1 hypothetical protein WN59_12845 [Salinicoccus sediminis]
MKKAAVIFNKKSGRTKDRPMEYEIIEQLGSAGYDVEILYTPPEGARQLAKEKAAGSDLIVAAGGDGTIGEVIGGITESGCKPLLSVLPAGTVNDYARTLGLPLDLNDTISALSEKQRTIEADVIRYNDQYAGYLIALGDFMESFTRVKSETKNRFGSIAYLHTGIRALVTMKPYEVRITLADEEIMEQSLLTIVANASSVGSFERLLPEASLDDGNLHVLNIRESSPKEILEIIWLALKNRITEHKNVRYLKTEWLKVEADRLSVMDVDGDPYPFEPLDISLLKGRVRVSIPEKEGNEK